MAEAEAKFRTVVDGVTLKLTGDEAKMIRDILYRVGGSPDTSRRGMADAIASALDDAGVHGSDEDDIRKGSTIYFE